MEPYDPAVDRERMSACVGSGPTGGWVGGGEWRYCTHCRREMTGPDACLGLLPFVMHACCGHGFLGNAYIVVGGYGPPLTDEDASLSPQLVEFRGEAALVELARRVAL